MLEYSPKKYMIRSRLFSTLRALGLFPTNPVGISARDPRGNLVTLSVNPDGNLNVFTK